MRCSRRQQIIIRNDILILKKIKKEKEDKAIKEN